MDKECFWKSGVPELAGTLDAMNAMLSDSYIFIIDRVNKVTWWSKQAQEHFGIKGRICKNGTEVAKQLVFPFDYDEYREEMQCRIRANGKQDVFCIRIRAVGVDYHLFHIQTQHLQDDEYRDYILVTLKDVNVMPDIDPLTDLYSQAMYERDLEIAVEKNSRLAVLKIGIERLNIFNIAYGAEFANRMLKEIALHFIYAMDENTAVYRIEGAMFAFILKGYGREELIRFEQKIRKILERKVYVDGNQTPLIMSAGGILLQDFEGDRAEIRSKVSYALNHSAREHQGELIIFNDEVQTSGTGCAQLELMKIIYQSVRNNCKGFYVEYQPIVDAMTGKIVGAEALVRWYRRSFGKVPPGMFIEWMEEDTAMFDLGNFVMETALTQGKELLEICPKFFLNVNVSARQLERHEFRDAVAGILRRTGFPPTQLCMELTERCKDMPLSLIKSEVEYFKSLGIHFAMDDYGTGSASSSIVMSVPMDEIKLDMSFVRGIKDNPKKQAMVQSIVEFAHDTGMTTCIEGVENEEVEQFLRQYQSTWFQGYHYSKPVPMGGLVQMLLLEKEKEGR